MVDNTMMEYTDEGHQYLSLSIEDVKKDGAVISGTLKAVSRENADDVRYAYFRVENGKIELFKYDAPTEHCELSSLFAHYRNIDTVITMIEEVIQNM